jgi:hypothetical protein
LDAIQYLDQMTEFVIIAPILSWSPSPPGTSRTPATSTFWPRPRRRWPKLDT